MDILLRLDKVMFGAAWFIKTSIANVENIHRLHRDLIKPGRTAVPLFAAKSTLTRASRRCASVREAVQPAAKVVAAPRPKKGPRAPSEIFASVRRALSDFEVFKIRKSAQDRTQNIVLNPVKQATKAALWDAWERADIEGQAICGEIAENTKAIARANRQSDQGVGASSTDLPALCDVLSPSSVGSSSIVQALPPPDVLQKPICLPISGAFHDDALHAVFAPAIPAFDAVSVQADGALPWSPSLYKQFMAGRGFSRGSPSIPRTSW